MTKTIVVTQEMIDRANKLRGKTRSKHCPIALAVNCAFRTRHGWSDNQSAGVSRARNPVEFVLPQKAKDFVIRFDDEQPVKPINFMVKVKSVAP